MVWQTAISRFSVEIVINDNQIYPNHASVKSASNRARSFNGSFIFMLTSLTIVIIWTSSNVNVLDIPFY